jgi:glycosyltransferase involved in cell wall biosynthesis
MGIIANLLKELGHEVVWWTSAFDHQSKEMRPTLPEGAKERLGYDLRLLRGCGYKRNVGFARILDQKITAIAFAREAASELEPEIILTSYPTIDLCQAVVNYGNHRGIPVVIDSRDMWPDIFLNLAPTGLKFLARLALAPMYQGAHRVMAGATSLIGITEPFVEWACKLAGRERTDLDQAFPLAYNDNANNIAEFDLERARKSWTDLGIELGDHTICFFGTLSRQFDIPTLIRAAQVLQRTGIKFVICGTGERLNDYRNQAKAVNNIFFPGWVNAAGIVTLMERSLAGIAPYLNEKSFTLSIPNKAIEYMAGGLPILTCLSGELQKIIYKHECGLYWKEGSVDELVGVVEVISTNKMLREKMAFNSSKLFKDEFVAGKIYGRLIDHLQLVVKRPLLNIGVRAS